MEKKSCTNKMLLKFIYDLSNWIPQIRDYHNFFTENYAQRQNHAIC